MRIGIDMDDTICRTTEKVHEYLELFSNEINLNPLDIMNDEDLREQFLNKYSEEIYKNVEIKRNVEAVLKRIKNKGNEIYIITSRNIKDSDKITREWLEKEGIEVDDVIINATGQERSNICKKYNIDLMIDNDPLNYKMLITDGINALLFDDREKYELKEKYVTNWLDIEKYIERNH